ncbi:alpha/beta fold hydrolase [Streptomyces xanthii]|uniref:Alpha/beta fold hydrolase n=1 Tax=Streptomyces xanthii TaxID=2768069 RepID=A0A7H1BH17_9ACTN|nr:alpha/beta hydrolase [Streptomyces xanthii]QNS08022.1 alpha/beta fold hydrolase [Streptomyces xanthii]
MSPRAAVHDPPHPHAYDPDVFSTAYERVLSKWPAPHSSVTVPTPFGATHVNVCGPADGPPVLLLPGGGGATSAPWYAQAAALSRTHRVHAVDLLGAPGRSVPDPGRGPRTLDDLMDWLGSVLDGLGLGGAEVDVVGHSYGAWIALHHALRTPARTRRLVLLDPTQCFAGFRPAYLLRALPMLLRPTPRRVRAFLEWESGGADTLDPHCLALQEAAARFPALRPATGPRPAPDALRAFTSPALILFAGAAKAHDARELAATARESMPEATVTVLPGIAHHALPPALPEATNHLIARFLD